MENIDSLGLFYVNIWLIIQRSTTNDSYLPSKQKEAWMSQTESRKLFDD